LTGSPQPSLNGLAQCVRCPRLAVALETSRMANPAFHARPVPPFGDIRPSLLVVGLAPGFNGANRTGRPFTGDYAGQLLFGTLHKFGWANHAGSASPDDGLVLTGCRITNAVKCWPPENKPLPAEVRTCNTYLAEEIAALAPGSAVLALGQIAHGAVLRASGLKISSAIFGHGAEADLPRGLRLFDSYHCSRYNTQTRRLTAEMFEDVFRTIGRHLAGR
jgi:uracil-DNA glycosylase family 4